MATLYDSTDLAAIPDTAELVGAYVDGKWPTFGAAVLRFGPDKVISITTLAKSVARVVDCEEGNASPAEVADWCKDPSYRVPGFERATVYCPIDLEDAVFAALADVGLTAGDVDWWFAHWTGEAHLEAGSVATQYANPPGSGGDFDLSLTNGIWPAVAPPPPKGDAMEGVAQWETGGQTHLAAVINNVMYHWWQSTGGNAPPKPAWDVEALPMP